MIDLEGPLCRISFRIFQRVLCVQLSQHSSGDFQAHRQPGEVVRGLSWDAEGFQSASREPILRRRNWSASDGCNRYCDALFKCGLTWPDSLLWRSCDVVSAAFAVLAELLPRKTEPMSNLPWVKTVYIWIQDARALRFDSEVFLTIGMLWGNSALSCTFPVLMQTGVLSWVHSNSLAKGDVHMLQPWQPWCLFWTRWNDAGIYSAACAWYGDLQKAKIT